MFGMYSHYGNGHSFSVINAPSKHICFSNMDSEQRFGTFSNDPLDFIGGPAITSHEKLEGINRGDITMSSFSSAFSSSGFPITAGLSKKKMPPKIMKSMQQQQAGIDSMTNSNMPVDEEHLEVLEQVDPANSYFGMCPTAWIAVGPGPMPPPPPPHFTPQFHPWIG